MSVYIYSHCIGHSRILAISKTRHQPCWLKLVSAANLPFLQAFGTSEHHILSSSQFLIFTSKIWFWGLKWKECLLEKLLLLKGEGGSGEESSSQCWKGPQKFIWSNLSWQGESKWDYPAPCPVTSWKPSVSLCLKQFCITKLKILLLKMRWVLL